MPKYLTVGKLKASLVAYPDDMKICINESCAEATGIARDVKLVTCDDDAPYDKGDTPYYTGELKENEAVLYINT